jgi:type VI secretion system secreted protein Hcp
VINQPRRVIRFQPEWSIDMSIDCHLKLDGVKGESTHAKHKDEVALQSWSWGAANASNSSGGGMAVGKGKPQDLHITKKYDKASPVLSKNCAAGTHFKEATLSMSVAGGKQEDFLVIKLKEVFVTSHQVSAGAGGEVSDQVSLSYGDIEYSYKPQKEDGSLDGEVKFGWNTRTTETR